MFNLLTAKYTSELSRSPAYQSFRSTVPQRKLIVDEDPSKVWTYYDGGPREITCPLVCFPPVSGTAITFFNQILALTARGYRVIAVQYPVYWSIKEFCIGFRKFLDKLNLNKVHIFGASLGGFLAQKFVEDTALCPRVKSLILCNSFCDTSIFNYGDMAPFFWMLPSTFLKKLVMANYAQGPVDANLADSIDFMVEQIESLSQQELASRLTLNCQPCSVNADLLQNVPITIIDVFDDCALSPQAKEHMYFVYPRAKKAHLKKGRNFPYLSCCDQVNLHIQVHLRQFINTSHSACIEPSELTPGNVSPAVEAVEDGSNL